MGGYPSCSERPSASATGERGSLPDVPGGRAVGFTQRRSMAIAAGIIGKLELGVQAVFTLVRVRRLGGDPSPLKVS